MTEYFRQGTVEKTLISPEHGYPTFVQEKGVLVTPHGFQGDAHSGPKRDSYSNPGTLKDNDRPISIVSQEVMLAMRKKFGLYRTMIPGGFNEQLLVKDLGDLSDVKRGDEVTLQNGVRLQIVDSA